MFPIWKDLSPIEGFYIPYIHLIKCFPLKSYIWPHIGLGRSWRRFLFLSKLVMSPDNSAGKGLFFPAPFSSCSTWGGGGGEGGSFSSLPCRNETLHFNKKPFQVNLLKNMAVSSCILGLHLPGPVSQMGFLEGFLCPRALWALLSPAVLRARSVQLCRAPVYLWQEFWTFPSIFCSLGSASDEWNLLPVPTWSQLSEETPHPPVDALI